MTFSSLSKTALLTGFATVALAGCGKAPAGKGPAYDVSCVDLKTGETVYEVSGARAAGYSDRFPGGNVLEVNLNGWDTGRITDGEKCTITRTR